jgi:hypothetical protein
MSERLFSNFDLTTALENQILEARKIVDSCEEDYLLGVSVEEYTAHLVSKFKIEAPRLGEPHMLQPREVDIDVSRNPLYGGRAGTSFAKGYQVEIRVPFEGDSTLFRARPSTFTASAPLACVQHDCISFVFSAPGELNGETVKAHYERELMEVREYLARVEGQCSGFNSLLPGRVRAFVTGRKSRLLANRKAAENIGLPLIHRDDAPQTYTVPTIKRKPEIQRPVVTEKSFVPEPAIAAQEYEHILGIIQSMVSVMERSPKAFAHMGEEDLRWHFLMQLNGQYQGRATGETFNFQGKTDILIREGDRNVFIAECKIWKGEGELLSAIDQILSYLHWRDTKTALMVFNRNKSFSDVLAKIEPAVQGHKCCKRLIKKVGETEWRFLFQNPDDSNRELQLAIMLFDIPKEAA